jgi:hypothetical protein
MSNPHGVRRATDIDVEVLAELVPQILAESEVLPLSVSKIQALVERCCLQKGGAIAGVIDGDAGAIDASIGMTFVESPISDQQYISVVWCGLSPMARQLPDNVKSNDKHPRQHYGRRLFDFARWAHEGIERAYGQPVIMRWDVLTRENLTPKMGLYSRHVPQIGAYYGLGAIGVFKPQVDAAAVDAAA